MNNAEVLAEAEAVIAALYPPQWTDAGLRRLMIASWDDAVDSNFITRKSLDG